MCTDKPRGWQRDAQERIQQFSDWASECIIRQEGPGGTEHHE